MRICEGGQINFTEVGFMPLILFQLLFFKGANEALNLRYYGNFPWVLPYYRKIH